MKKIRIWKSYTLRFLLIVGGLMLILFQTGSLFSNILKSRLTAELSKMEGSVGSININLFKKSISVHHLIIGVDDENFNLSLDKVEVSGISLFQFLVNDHIKIKHILLDGGSVDYLILKRDSFRENQKKSFNYSLMIESIELKTVNFSIKNDSLLALSGTANLSLGNISYDSSFSINKLGSSFHHLTGSLSKLVYKEATGFYTVLADSIQFDSFKHSLIFDSIKLIPNYGKIEFARVLGKQATRIDLSIPRLVFSEIDYLLALNGSLSISHLSIDDSKVYAFRDKRLPFLKSKIVPMPMLGLARLPYKIKIDSVAIARATILMEEFAEDAKEMGHVEFNNVKALLTGLSNQSQNLNPAVLNASANFMKTGLIEAMFMLPIDTTKEYTAEGKVSNVPLSELNNITSPAASLKFESGVLNNLYFNFAYTDYKSLGEIQINYKDLKVVSLTHDKSVRKVKSAVINALLKDTKDKSTPVKNRKGKIEFERDRKRFIFHLWWKSIQSGIKDSIVGKKK